jgi:hypothetical protein
MIIIIIQNNRLFILNLLISKIIKRKHFVSYKINK